MNASEYRKQKYSKKPAKQIMNEQVKEEDFQQQIIEYAHLRGWKVAHFRPARMQDDEDGEEVWRTPVQADGKGFFDLVLTRERVVWMEVKSEKGRLSKDQKNWRDWILRADGEYYCVQPSDWEIIEVILR